MAWAAGGDLSPPPVAALAVNALPLLRSIGYWNANTVCNLCCPGHRLAMAVDHRVCPTAALGGLCKSAAASRSFA